ncbi:MAG: hypothetical protein J5I98_35785, partial [Phaeodactylibacter sp.]|nr:hypothetical protein [Phaeodactylibacter sp.]
MPFTIRMNIHFHPNPDGSNFDVATGKMVAQQLVALANAELNNLAQNERPGPGGAQAPLVPSARFQYEIYTDPANPEDPHGGIWFHPGQASESDAYAGLVVDIHCRDARPDGTRRLCHSGVFLSGGSIEIYGLLDCWEDDMGWYARILNHEVGHSLSLGHSSYCQNQCQGIDLDPEQECGPLCPSQGTCEPEPNPSQVFCPETGETVGHCTWNFGNNIMQQGYRINALTPCQWETAYRFALNSQLPMYVFGGECEGTGPPIVIPSNTEKTWDFPRTVSGDVIVEPNATLYVNCLVLMGPGRRFHVKRGGKLVVQNGAIRAWCEEERWGGIWVEGNRGEEQPDYEASVNDYGDHLAGVVVLLNATLEGAGTAVTTRKLGDPDNRDYFGGLVFAAHSDFVGNKRAVEFMLYEKPNKSLFFDNLFDGLGEPGSMGVTIWRCHGIAFDYNIFRNMLN